MRGAERPGAARHGLSRQLVRGKIPVEKLGHALGGLMVGIDLVRPPAC
jgi:hypothetical protein